MGKILRSLLCFVLGALLLTGVSSAQKKTADPVQQRAGILLKNYKPPEMHPVPETGTPKEAWKQFYEKKDQRTTGRQQQKTTGAPAEPQKDQYSSNKRGFDIRERMKQVESLPVSAQDRRKAMEEHMRQETANGRGPAWEMRKLNLPFAPSFDEQQRRADELRKQQPAALLQVPQQKNEDRLNKRNTFDPNRTASANTSLYGVLMGTVFQDLNHSSSFDAGDTAMAGCRIRIYGYYGGRNDTVVTDANGDWSFDDTTGGDCFYIYVLPPSGYRETYPYYNSSYNWYCLNNSTDTSRNLNFGIWPAKPNILKGNVFNDANHNGNRDTSETGISDRMVYIYSYLTGSTISVTPDANGDWSFIDSLGGTSYQIYQSEQFGWLLTTNNGYYYRYTNTMWGDTVSNLDFGYWLMPPVAINGYVFDDANHNGVRDSGETPLPGWTINALRYATYTTLTAVSDSTGYYEIRDSGYTSTYQVTETKQDGWLQTVPYSYYYFSLAGDTATGKDFGNWLVPFSSIRGTVFNDTSNNGQHEINEPGLAGWKVYAFDEYHGDTLVTRTDSTGHYQFDSLIFVSTSQSYFTIWVDKQLDWQLTYPWGGTWRPYIQGDTLSSADFGYYLPPYTGGDLRVNTLPSNAVSVTYGNAVINQPLAVWGNLHNGAVPLHYSLDYGDGTIDTGIVYDRHFLGSMHIYQTAGPKTVVLKVTDSRGQVDSSISIIRAYAAASKQIRINMAIEKGLLYNYLQQYPDGHWTDNSNYTASTGAALLTFEENGHKPSNRYKDDIYAEYVRLGLNYLLANASQTNISDQPMGNPDGNGNGHGAYLNYNTYSNGIGMLAIIGAYPGASGAQADTITVGPYAGSSLYDFAQDAMDQWAYAQTDPGYSGEGGWRYNVPTSNDGSQDNSTTQWAALDLEAGENSWGLAVPPWVKTELVKALQYTQNDNGGFGYDAPWSWVNITKTAAAIGSYAFAGYTTDSLAIQKAITFIDNQWNLTGNDDNWWLQPLSGNMYAMYGVAKGMRIINHRTGNQFIGTHDWYEEYATHLLDDPGYAQNPDGSWPRITNTRPASDMGDPLFSSLGVLILTRGVVTQPPVAIIQPLGTIPPDQSLQVDGSASFHQDPTKSIVEWLWDFNAANGVDWSHADASGPAPSNPGYHEEGTYTITLRVKDNSDPPQYSITTANVRVVSGHHQPVAVAIPPTRGKSYAARVGEPILLDGRASFSPDYPQDSVVAYNWDLNGDGIFGDALTDTVTVTFPSEHQGQVGLRVYDTQGDSSSNIAYITIVASRKDLFVKFFEVTPSPVYTGGVLNLNAIFKNNDTSNTNASNVLVRFYDDNPLTIGNRLGGDFYINLPVGAQDTVITSVMLSNRILPGVHHFYVYLDANDQQPEWNKENNLSFVDIPVLAPPPHIVPPAECLNFATLSLGDSLMLPIVIGNTGPGILSLDSLIIASAEYYVQTPESMIVSPGVSETLQVVFKPTVEGVTEVPLSVYTNDGTHTVMLNGQGELHATGTGQQIFSGLATVAGDIVPPGTVIGAYRTSGQLIASMRVKVPVDSINDDINYVLSLLEGQAGIAAGDTILFAVRSLDCGQYWEQHCDPLRIAIFSPAFPPPDGFTRYNIDGVPERKLTIPLYQGYNAVSWNLYPLDQTVPGIFGSLLTQKIKIVLDFVNDGRNDPRYEYYIPALGQYNPFTLTTFRKGYFVRMQNERQMDSLVLTGQPICPQLPLSLNSGYNFISYLPPVSDAVSHAFASLHQENLIIALDYQNQGGDTAGFAYYPNGSFNTMAPGRGYFAKLTTADTLTYPASSITVAAKTQSGNKTVSGSAVSPKRFALSQPGTLPQAIFAYGLHVQLNGKLVPKGTDITAIAPSGVVCGSGTFVADGIFSMAIYADDPSTPKVEGAQAGDMVKISIGKQLIAQEIKWTEFGDTPQLDGSQMTTGVLYDGGAIPQTFALHQNYPNPFNPATMIRYDVPKASFITLKIYDMLGREVRTLEQEELQAGYYQTVWDGRNNSGQSVSSGIYTYRFTATGGTGKAAFVDTHKMIMVK